MTVSLKVLGAGAVSWYLFAQRAHTVAEHGRTDSHFNLKTEPLWPTALQWGTVKSGKSNKRRQGQKSLSGSAGTDWPPFGPLLLLNPTVPYASAASSQHPSKAMATAYWTPSQLLRLNSPKPYVPFLAEWRYHTSREVSKVPAVYHSYPVAESY